MKGNYDEAFISNLHKEGFVIFELDDENLTNAIENYFSEGREFFSQSFEEKDKLETLEETGTVMRKANRGYVHVKDRAGEHVKEFLKLSLRDPDSAFPTTPESLKETFHDLFARLNRVAKKSLEVVANFQVEKGKQTYMSPQVYDHLVKHVDEKSSISLIRYFPRDEACIPSAEHVDTGLLTFISCATVPGLQVKDRASGEWIEVEKMVTPLQDMFVIIGKKVQLLAAVNTDKPYFSATEHRVALPAHTERNSLLFFLDVKQ